MTDSNREIFVVAKIDFKDPKGRIIVEKGDVGRIEKQKTKDVTIFFLRTGKRFMARGGDFESHFKILDLDEVRNYVKNKDGLWVVNANQKERICNFCSKLKSVREYKPNRYSKDGKITPRPSCNDCRKKIEGKRLTKSEQNKFDPRPNNILFKCKICEKRTIAGVNSKVVLDHDHESGKARGWICESCNTGLGRFQDSVVILKRAINFIKKGSRN